MIVAAAIMYKGVVFTGVRHLEIISDINRLVKSPEKALYTQGFITERNKFMGRHESLDYAFECGQIKVKDDGNFDIMGGVITSEDLW